MSEERSHRRYQSAIPELAANMIVQAYTKLRQLEQREAQENETEMDILPKIKGTLYLQLLRFCFWMGFFVFYHV